MVVNGSLVLSPKRQGSFKEVSRVFQGCFKDVSRTFPERVSRVFQGCFKDVSRMLKGFSRLFQGVSMHFKDVLWVFQGCFKGV